jgi:hypothetical protein
VLNLGTVKEYQVYVSGGRDNGSILTPPSANSNQAILVINNIGVFELVNITAIAVSPFGEQEQLSNLAIFGVPATSDVLKQGIQVRLLNLSYFYAEI